MKSLTEPTRGAAEPRPSPSRAAALASWIRSTWAWVWLSLIMLPLFPVAAAYRVLRGPRDLRGDGFRRLIASWVSIYGETTPLYRFDMRGRSRLPTDRPYVLVANHESGLDVLCLLMLRTPARFVAEDFLFAIPLAGWLFRASEQIPVTIGDRESGRQALARAAEALQAGTPVAFFPEGLLSPDEMISFKPGAFVCAQRAGVPIVPVLIEGAGRAWRPGTMVVQGRHVIRMQVLEPIEAEAHRDTDPEALAARVRQQLIDAREDSRSARGARSGVALALALIATSLGCATAPRPYDIPSEQRIAAVDDRAWDALLTAHVDEGRVEYAAFCDAPALSSYLADVERVELRGATDAERMALYVNAYNALSIRGILRGQSPSTLLGRHGFFVRERARVAGEEMSLLTLERRVIVPMGDPRIHFALVCASASCPWLRDGVYAADALEGQLDEAARRFVNDPDKNRFDVGEGRARVSAIFDWYRDEFATEAGSLGAYLARYVQDAEVAAALDEGRIEIEFLDYDWSLNGSAPGPNGRCPQLDD